MKQKIDLLIRGSLISDGCIAPLEREVKIINGGGVNPSIIWCEAPEEYYDLSNATIIEGDVHARNLYYNHTVVVTGGITALGLSGEGGMHACR